MHVPCVGGSVSSLNRNQATSLTHFILALDAVAALQLDQGLMNTSQLKDATDRICAAATRRAERI